VGGSVGSGGSGGKGVNLNGTTVTWTGGSSSTSRVYGAIS
jgi:archaellin